MAREGRVGWGAGPWFLAAAGASFAVSHWGVLGRLRLRWDGGDDSYCYLVPVLFAYLCWEKRKSFRFGEVSWSGWGLAVLAGAALLTVAGELGSLETVQYAGVWASAAGVAVTLYGRRARGLFFPFVVLLFIVPLPPFVNQVLTFRLRMAATSLSVQGLRALGVAVFQEGNVLDLGVRTLEVGEACSGLRYVMPMFLAGLLLTRVFDTRGGRDKVS